MKKSTWIVAIALTLSSVPTITFPQNSPTFERFLVPIFIREAIPGAFGSSWMTDFWISNSGPVPVDFGGGFDFGCSFPPCVPGSGTLNPGVTFRPRVIARPDGLQGTFVLADAQSAEGLSWALRFRDLSRQSQTWGTEVPVVREAEFRSEKISLIDIPRTTGFREVLRVYSAGDNGAQASVRVRAYRIRSENDLPNALPDSFLGESVLHLQFVSPGSSAYPGYAAVFDLGTIASLGGVDRIRLDIEPISPGVRVWAFVTVVSNETQHATVITPQ